MSLTFQNPGLSVSEDDIKAIEAVIGTPLPTEYRLFLCRYNGGHPEPNCFNGFGDNSTFSGSSIHYFYGIGESSPHVQLVTAFNTLKGRLPKGLIPIADDPYGNQVCITTQGNEIGTVYFWDHEAEHTPPTFKNMHKLASSFEKFISGFFESEHVLETALDKAIKKDDVKSLQRLIDSGVQLDQQDQWGRTLIENAAIANSVDVIGYLFALGADVRNALSLAEKNAKFFPEHQRAVALLKQLKTPN